MINAYRLIVMYLLKRYSFSNSRRWKFEYTTRYLSRVRVFDVTT